MEKQLTVSYPGGTLSAVRLGTTAARAILVLAHGAGAGMRHPFLNQVTLRLAERSIASLRFQFPYMERGSKRPDPPATLASAVCAAVEAAHDTRLPPFAGGKSMGGRITSMAAAEGKLPRVRGLVFLGYPLHPPGKRDGATIRGRTDHLFRITVPMLFLQGTRDRLAEIDRMRELCRNLGRRATLIELESADHSFAVPARSQRTGAGMLQMAADAAAEWMLGLV
jgi:uncharacterized protein